MSSLGLTEIMAHDSITKAMQNAEAMTLVTMDFLRLPIIATIGVILYFESFELSLMVGTLLMLTGNLIGLSSIKANNFLQVFFNRSIK